MSFGGSTKQVPDNTPYFQAMQQLIGKDAMGLQTPTMPSIFGTAGPGGQNGGGGGTPYRSPISYSTGAPTGTGGTGGNSPSSILMQMLNSFAPGGGVPGGGGSVAAAPTGTSGPGGISLAVQPPNQYGYTGPASPAEAAAAAAGQNPTGPGGVNAPGPNWLDQIFNPGSALPAGSIPSLDSILQTETGANSAFTNNILPMLMAQFAQTNKDTAAAAKESAGNLTGSGFANTLGTAMGRSAATEGADISSILASLGGQQLGVQNQDLLAQYGAQNNAQSQNANAFMNLMNMIFNGGKANTISTPGWSSILPGLLGAGGQLGAAAITSGNNNNNSGSNGGS